MKVSLTNSILGLFLVLSPAWGWIATSPTCTTWSSPSAAITLSTRLSSSLLSDSFNDDDEPQSSSRRQWLLRTAVATTAASAALFNSPPAALAAAVVSTKNTCDVSVSIYNNPVTNRQVYILGTAHISTESANLAGEVVQDVKPNAVFVELDAKRVGLKPNKAPSAAVASSGTSTSGTNNGGYASDQSQKRIEINGTPESVVNGPSLPPTAASSKSSNNNGPGLNIGSAAIGGAIKGMYGKLGEKGFSPGEEFVVAVRAGQALGATIILGDQNVDVTLSRLSQALRKTDFKALLSPDSEMEQTMTDLMPSSSSALTAGDVDNDNFNAELTQYVETMKSKENVRLIMHQLQTVAPEIYQAMVAERDVYMANGLDTLNDFPIIVAVMGMAHTEGVENYLESKGWERAKPKCSSKSAT